jgi:hypothetical protein
MQELICPLCNEKIYSDIGNGCRMCAMPINEQEIFCCDLCEDNYHEINNE